MKTLANIVLALICAATIGGMTAWSAIDPASAYVFGIPAGMAILLCLYLCFLWLDGRAEQDKKAGN